MYRISLFAIVSVALLTNCNFSGAGPAFLQDNTEADQSAGDDAVTSDTSPDQHGPDVVTEDTPTEDAPLEDTPMEDTPMEDTSGPDAGIDTIENLCLAAGGTCMIPLPDEDGDGCPDGYTPENLPGCGDMEICCVPSVNPCVPEGEGFESFETDGMCCPGLVPVQDCFYEAGGCACPNCPCFVCTACGDGVCGMGENVCNCPEDCEGPPPECFGLGEAYNEFETDLTCCPGLTAVPDCFDEGSGCICPGCPCMICTECGDGSCGPFENKCNCPEDCSPVPPPPLECYPAFPDCPENSYCKLPQGQCYQEGAWGMCTVIPELCTWIMNPVCGCDQVTYDNECLMESAQQSMDYPGSCGP